MWNFMLIYQLSIHLQVCCSLSRKISQPITVNNWSPLRQDHCPDSNNAIQPAVRTVTRGLKLDMRKILHLILRNSIPLSHLLLHSRSSTIDALCFNKDMYVIMS